MTTTTEERGNLIEQDGKYYISCEAHEEVVRRAIEKNTADTLERVREMVDGFEVYPDEADNCRRFKTELLAYLTPTPEPTEKTDISH